MPKAWDSLEGGQFYLLQKKLVGAKALSNEFYCVPGVPPLSSRVYHLSCPLFELLTFSYFPAAIFLLLAAAKISSFPGLPGQFLLIPNELAVSSFLSLSSIFFLLLLML